MPKLTSLVPICGESVGVGFVIDSAGWLGIEKVSRYRLKGAVREQIAAETTRFLMLLPSKATIAASKKVVRAIRSAARKLHTAITHCSPTDLDAQFWAKYLIQTNIPVQANVTVGQMAFSIVKACDRAEAQLDNPTHLELEAGGNGSKIVKSPILHYRSAWAGWVCKLAKLLTDNGLKVTVAKDSDKRSRASSFVLLVYELQKHFPDRVDHGLRNLSTLTAAIDRVLKIPTGGTKSGRRRCSAARL